MTNFDKVLDERLKRIHEFVAVMQKLAVGTVAKRDHLDELN